MTAGETVCVGQGFDAHRFTDGRPLVLGGVTVPHDRGLAGTSDADVLTHAVADAILGALALGDLGRHFPSAEERWRDAVSLDLLAETRRLVEAAGGRVVRVDATLILEAPRVAPHVPAMRANLSRVLGLAPDRVSVKATTTDGMGFTGRGEGAAALAVVQVLSVPGTPSGEAAD